MEAPQPPEMPQPDSAILSFFIEQRDLAEEFGDWGFKILVLLVAIALIKWFPYRFFYRSHQLLSLVYLFLVAHSVVLMEFSYWGAVIGPLMAVLMLAGSLAAAKSLLGRIGVARKAVGEVEEITYVEQNAVLKLRVRLFDRWAGHEEGQFAFVTFDRSEGAHPFTIASDWKGDGRIGFFIKGLGDYTRKLPESAKPGDLVTVEGPYGRFEFDSDKPRQIWIAGGIGIAPFAARLKALRGREDATPIDLFYSAGRQDDDAYIQRMKEAAREANVSLHVIRSSVDGRLDAAKVRAVVPDLEAAGVWFCGPTGFGDAMLDGLTAEGLPESSFHRELFEMR